MKTHQDLLAVGENERDRMAFIQTAINEHKESPEYKLAVDGDLYYRHLNPTIARAQKLIYDALGQAHINKWTANHKIPSRWFFFFTNQTVQTLLGNGVSFRLSEDTKDRFTADFDEQVQKTATKAICGGVAFGYLSREETNAGEAGKYRVQVFDLLDFVPLRDEDNGSLRSGIRFWQLPSKKNDKPLHAVLYEESGYTSYIKRNGQDWAVLEEKQPYIQIVESSGISGETVVNGKNYPGFPIVPLWNINEQSDLVGNQAALDAYDLLSSDLVNNVDEGNLIYWVIRNAGGMDAEDASRFIRQIHSSHVAMVEGDENIEPHNIQAPVQASESALETLRVQLFDDFMAFDPKTIASGAVTATQIKAAYEPLNSKLDLFEYQVSAFILGLLQLIDVDDRPTYTRSMIVNQSEVLTNLATMQTLLPLEYLARKAVEVLGDTDKADEVLAMIAGEDMGRFNGGSGGNTGDKDTPDKNNTEG